MAIIASIIADLTLSVNRRSRLLHYVYVPAASGNTLDTQIRATTLPFLDLFCLGCGNGT